MAAVIKHATVVTSSSLNTCNFLSFIPRSTVSWKCLQIAAWRTGSGYQGSYLAGTSIGTFFFQVGQVNKAEFRVAETYHDCRNPSVVIPFGDGISFSGSEQVRVQITPDASSIYRMSSTMIGEE